MGLQWLVASPRFDHDAWINWQRLNTAEHSRALRRRLPRGRRTHAALRLHGQWHIVHEGGQQFDNGAVSDSQAVAVGPRVDRADDATRLRFTLDGHAVATRYRARSRASVA